MFLEVRLHTQKEMVKWILNNKWKGSSSITFHISTINQNFERGLSNEPTVINEPPLCGRIHHSDFLCCWFWSVSWLILVSIFLTSLYCTQQNSKVSFLQPFFQGDPSLHHCGVACNLSAHAWAGCKARLARAPFCSCHWGCTCSTSNTVITRGVGEMSPCPKQSMLS